MMQIFAENTINDTTVVENVLCNTCNDNPGYKVRQIRYGLRHFFKSCKEHLI